MRLFLSLWLLSLATACSVIEGPALSTGDFCDPRTPNRCRPGFCLPLDGSTGVCTESCRQHGDCPKPLVCQPDEGGDTALCRPGFLCSTDTECPTGHRCDGSTGSCFIPVSRRLCSACQADPQCPAGGRCVEAKATGERFCSQPCSEAGGCPRGFVCDEGQCLPESGSCEGGRPLCAPCRGDAVCGDGNDICIENLKSGARFCGRSCNIDCKREPTTGEWKNGGQPCVSECPGNFSCSDLSGEGTGPFQCVPHADTCEGFCEGGSREKDRLWCGLGRTCDETQGRCVPALDGRVCASCSDDSACEATATGTRGRCVVDKESGSRFCVSSCESEEGCRALMGPGFSCVNVEGSKLCLPDGGCGNGEGRLGDDCGDGGAGSCVGGICLRFGPEGICSGRCAADADCGPGYRCCGLEKTGDGHFWDCDLASGNEGAVCVPTGGGFGEACGDGRTPCADGYCLDLDASQVCTRTCGVDDPCPASFDCRRAHLTDGDGNPSGTLPICFPDGGGGPGADCTFGPAACAQQLCLRKQSGSICTQPCEGDKDCPKGWGCGPAPLVDGSEQQVCLPPELKP